MELSDAIRWASERKHAVLITLRSDGRAQSSDIAYVVSGGDFLISVTDDRAKTANMRRDDRVVLHITAPDEWSYASFDGTVELSDVAAEPNDSVVERLVDYYERVAGEPHPDWDDYRRAMVDEKRLLIRFMPRSVVGQIR